MIVENLLEPLIGQSVSQVRVDYNLTILVHTETHGGVLIMGNGRVALTPAVDGKAQVFELEDKDSIIGDLVDCCRFAEITGAKIEADGQFVIEFKDGSRLTSILDDDFESWELTAESGLRIVCRPGGEIVTWAVEVDE